MIHRPLAVTFRHGNFKAERRLTSIRCRAIDQDMPASASRRLRRLVARSLLIGPVSWTCPADSAKSVEFQPSGPFPCQQDRKASLAARWPARYPGLKIETRTTPCRWRARWRGRTEGDRDHAAHRRQRWRHPPCRRRSRGSSGRRRHHPGRRTVRRGGAAGSKFIVSPGVTGPARRCFGSEVPLLPGAITPGEIMAAREAGLDFLKFFPAEQAGGAAFLKSLASPFAGIRSARRAACRRKMRRTISRCRMSSASAAPGSPRTILVKAKDWAGIEALAREASGFARANIVAAIVPRPSGLMSPRTFHRWPETKKAPAAGAFSILARHNRHPYWNLATDMNATALPVKRFASGLCPDRWWKPVV